MVKPRTATNNNRTNAAHPRPELSTATYAIHSTNPVAASTKCPKISGEGNLLGLRCLPRLAIQVPSRKNPAPAVTIHVISAATSTVPLQSQRGRPPDADQPVGTRAANGAPG